METHDYTVGVNRALGWGYALIAVLYAAMWLIAAASVSEHVGPWLWSAILGFSIAALSTCWHAWRRLVGPADVAWMLAASLAIQATWALTSDASFGSGLRTTTVGVVLYGSLMFVRRGVREVVIVVAVGAEVWVDVARSGHAAALEGLLPVATVGTTLALLVRVLRRAAATADRASEKARAADRAAAEQKADARVRGEIQALLHDDVAAALRAASLESVAGDDVRRAARSAVRAISRFAVDEPTAAPRDVVADLAQLVGASPGAVLASTGPVVVPADVAEAILGAATEALRNVARHARAERVEVSVAAGGDGVVVTVSDDGVGFRPEAAMPSAHGLRYSVVRRLEVVGGGAEVESSPGHGTTVRVHWEALAQAPSARPRSLAARADVVVGDLRHAYVAVGVPFLVLSAVWAVYFTASGELPPWLLAWYVGLAGVTIATVIRMRRGVPGWLAAGALAYGLVGTFASLFLTAPGSLRGYGAWPVGAMSSIFAVLVVTRPAWEALASLAVHQGSIVAAVIVGRFELGPWPSGLVDAAPAMASTVVPVAIAWAVIAALGRLGDSVARSQRAVAAQAAQRHAVQAREAAREQWIREAQVDVVPFLEAVAKGVASPEDPATRERARVLEGGVRDELAIPGVLDEPTRALIRGARARGCRVVFQAPAALSPDRTVVRALLGAALSGRVKANEVVVSSQRVDGELASCLVVLPGNRVLERDLERVFGPRLRVVDSSREVTWVEVVPDPPN